jgi:ribosomal-protein-alanine N-acetyltransferase
VLSISPSALHHPGNDLCAEMNLRSTIETPRMSLRPAGEAWLTAFIASPDTFSLITNLRVADGCNEFPKSLRFSLDRMRRASAREIHWWAPLFFIERTANLVVGVGGYKGPPIQGTVEFGYSIAPAHRRRGLATEAAAALAATAFKSPGVESVIAHTLPVEGPSPRVLEKCGFVRAGESLDPDEGVVWRWELRREVR